MKYTYLLISLLVHLYTNAQISQVNNQSAKEQSFYEGLKYRFVGPYRGGRATTVTGVKDKLHTFYMGTTGGGVWKTDDAGNTWANISDGGIKVGSIGAVHIADADPNFIYVGTGSDCIRGNVSIGKGIYKSMDGGQNWKFSGLENAGQIGTVFTHPADPNIVYAGALGNPFGKNKDRGVFRSKDGGDNWEKVLFHSDSVGVADMIMHPKNPRIIYAGLWRAERKPWTIIDGSTEGGLYKSVDGGDSWNKVEGGLPTGLVGRIGIAISPANPDRMWVIQEAKEEKKGGVYRSDDSGNTWNRVCRDHNVRNRAWYYNHIHADPKDENTVYINNLSIMKSIDGGKSFRRIRTPHGDCHDLWINPDHPEIMINGNDGGACVSLNKGNTWSSLYNQPTAEFYRLTVDNQYPYRLYACQQDNSSISIPSSMPGGISPKQHWYEVGGGESGHVAIDPRDPNIVYSGNYIGQLYEINRKQGKRRDIVAYPELHDGLAPKDISFRYQWNAPIRLSPHNPDILYHCSQFVHKSMDGGQSWKIISPDLTSNNKAYQEVPGEPIQHDHTGVELYCTIFAFEESPHNAGELWAGSDDGLLHISLDAGENWQNITPPNFPIEATINTIELSSHTAGRAIISAYKYRENDSQPYIFLTDDFGKSWKSLANGKNGIPADHFVRVVREDPDRKGLLYAGTEFGMFISFDEGGIWTAFQLNLPITPITDMQVYRKDLVIATQGRSFWILDDLSPLHQWSDDILSKEAFMFQPTDGTRSQRGRFRAADAPETRTPGVYFHIFCKSVPDSMSTLRIFDSNDNLVKSFSTKPDQSAQESKINLKKGLNRIVWNLRSTAPKIQEKTYWSLASASPIIMPTGHYSARLEYGKEVEEVGFKVLKDPRWVDTSDGDLMAQYELSKQAFSKIEESHRAIGDIRSARNQIKTILEFTGENKSADIIQEKGNELAQKLTELELQLTEPKSESSQDPLNYTPKLDNQIAYLYNIVNRQDARPTDGSYQRLQDVTKELKVLTDKLEMLLAKDLKSFIKLLDDSGIRAINVPE